MIGKNRALELLDIRIDQFNDILSCATYNDIYGKEYHETYYGTESLIEELFSKEESMEFRRNVSTTNIRPERSEFQALQYYQRHIEKCISQLKVYQNKVHNFWDEETIINWSIVKSKSQPLFMILNKFKTSIILFLIILGLIAGAINNWQTVYGFINSTLK